MTATAMPTPTAIFVPLDQLLPLVGWICDLAAGNTLPALASATSLSTLVFNCSLGFPSFVGTPEGTLADSVLISGLDEFFAKAEVPHKTTTSAATSVTEVNLLSTTFLLGWMLRSVF